MSLMIIHHLMNEILIFYIHIFSSFEHNKVINQHGHRSQRHLAALSAWLAVTPALGKSETCSLSSWGLIGNRCSSLTRDCCLIGYYFLKTSAYSATHFSRCHISLICWHLGCFFFLLALVSDSEVERLLTITSPPRSQMLPGIESRRAIRLL